MIYTFSIEKNFFDYFKDNLDSRDARTIIDFITGNFINRDNFFLKGDRKTIFKQNTNGGNGTQLKTLLQKLNKKIKNFSKSEDTDFIFSIDKKSGSNVISVEDIINDKYIEIENNLNDNFKPYWKYSSKNSNQKNKRDLEKVLIRLIKVCDEIYFVDRHVPRTLCQYESSKIKFPKDLEILKKRLENKKIDENKYFFELSKIKKNLKSKESYHNSYNNSFEFFSNIINLTNPKTKKFFCGILKKDLRLLENEDTENNKHYKEIENELIDYTKKILINSFKNFKKNKMIVHVKSDHQAYQNKTSYRRQLIALVNGDLLTMIKTDKGLNFLDAKFELQAEELVQIKPELAYDDWEQWKVDVKNSPDLIKFMSI